MFFISCFFLFKKTLKSLTSFQATDNGTCTNTQSTACKEYQTGMGTYEIVIADINNNPPIFKSPGDKIEVNVEVSHPQIIHYVDILYNLFHFFKILTSYIMKIKIKR